MRCFTDHARRKDTELNHRLHRFHRLNYICAICEICGSLCLFMTLCNLGCDHERAAQSSAIAKLVVSGDTSSWITPCGCTTNQSGGLLRRAAYLKNLAAQGPGIY